MPFQETTAATDQDRIWIEALQTVLCADPNRAYNSWWQDFVNVAVCVTYILFPQTSSD